jgi:hypothetical protein
MRKLHFLMWLDKWYSHKLKLPGRYCLCRAFDRWIMGDEDDWGD